MLNVFSSNQTFDTFSELYFVTHLMGSDLNNIIRTQRLTDDHVRFLTYQVSFDGLQLKVPGCPDSGPSRNKSLESGFKHFY